MEKVTKTLKVINRFGLHARPSAMVVETASKFDADVSLIKDGVRADARSIMSVMLLAAEPGCEICLEATGSQAQDAADALDKLFQAKFHEET